MSPDHGALADIQRYAVTHRALAREPLEEQFENLEQQHHAATTGMWVFLATEVMFFGTLFASLSVYRYLYGEAFEKASERLNWLIGGLNTLVLLSSSFTIVLATRYAQLGRRSALVVCLALTAALGGTFLVLKGLEYYSDYRENLIPGWKFVPEEWTVDGGLTADQVPHVKLFLAFYWIMTLFHGLHVTIGIVAVLTMAVLAWRQHFSPAYYSPVEVTALYWHFVDIVWIFLLPMLYLLGTHRIEWPTF
jgi:cytochrome c oxidase subunit III